MLGCFSRPREIVAARRRALATGATRDVVGVLGVAAVAAADGSLFLLQHFHNAGDVFRLSKQVALVVALDKLVPTAEDALLQTRCTALFGAEATLLDLGPAGQMPAGVAIESLAAAEGVEEVHIILLDNGRRGLAEGSYRDLLACIGCRACAVRCPTYHAYAGPQRRCPREYLLHHLQGRNPSVDLCVGCGMRLAQCPVEIDIPAMMLRAKAGRSRGKAGFLLSSFEGMARLSSLAPAVSNAVASNPAFRRIAEPLLGLEAERAMPRFVGETFGRWFAKRQGPRRQERVAYYAGCTANYVEPAIGKATVALLDKAGLEVCYPEQVCCSMPQMNNGRLEAARRNLRSLVAADCDVVMACTSCALALKREYEHALGVDGAAELAARTHDAMEYLGRLRAEGRLPAPVARQSLLVLYHAPCHLKVRGDELVPSRVALMASLPGVEAKLVDRGCCGMAGTFGCRHDSYVLSMAIGSPLFEEVRRAAPDAVATDCPTCSMQLTQGTGLTPIHPVVLLRQAYGQEGGEDWRELASVQGTPERGSGIAL